MLREPEMLDMLSDWVAERVSRGMGLLQRETEAAELLGREVAGAQVKLMPHAQLLEWRDVQGAASNLASLPAKLINAQLSLCAAWFEFLAKQPAIFAECYAGPQPAQAAVFERVEAEGAKPAEVVQTNPGTKRPRRRAAPRK